MFESKQGNQGIQTLDYQLPVTPQGLPVTPPRGTFVDDTYYPRGTTEPTAFDNTNDSTCIQHYRTGNCVHGSACQFEHLQERDQEWNGQRKLNGPGNRESILKGKGGVKVWNINKVNTWQEQQKMTKQMELQKSQQAYNDLVAKSKNMSNRKKNAAKKVQHAKKRRKENAQQEIHERQFQQRENEKKMKLQQHKDAMEQNQRQEEIQAIQMKQKKLKQQLQQQYSLEQQQVRVLKSQYYFTY